MSPAPTARHLPAGARAATSHRPGNVAAVATRPSGAFHQDFQADHTTDLAAGPDLDTEMWRQISSAAVIMVGQEVHELTAACRQRIYAGGVHNVAATGAGSETTDTEMDDARFRSQWSDGRGAGSRLKQWGGDPVATG